ncbi:MAG: ABC transporter permease [Victivallales bacterium]|nr:ABC transporter permease [Victivallales bacterium]MCF7888587.1 ABC transporter permease [Victivallales bacterium]
MTLKNTDFERVGNNVIESELIYSKNMSYWEDVFRRLKKNKSAVTAFWIIIILIFFCIFGPLMNKFSFREMNHLIGSTWNWEVIKLGHYFGTDEFGRDFFTRVWEGGRVSFIIALVVVFFEGIIGAVYGGVAGFCGGKVDLVMMRIVEILFVIPPMIYIILLMIVMGPGIATIIVAMSISRWVPMAMIVRGEVLRIKEYEFVMASQALGAGPVRILFKHLLPNTLGLIIVRLTLDIPRAVFTEAFLSFIGIGVPAPFCSWGSLSNDGYIQLYSDPYLFLIPAILISIVTFSFNIIGDGLRDALDPKLRR